jgi:phosphonoacetate hydrolase
MITDDKLLRGSTILQLMSKRGVRVAAVTAKDKLRALLRHDLDEGSICFSAEKVSSCTLQQNGIENVEDWLGQKQPSQYSGTLSLYVLDAGIKLLQEDKSDLFFLTLSDYVQHKHAPGEKESDQFFSALDARIGKLLELGAQVVVTGDHGMSDKTKPDGTPNVLFLEDAINQRFGAGAARIICPITDPFVKHHGALGSFVRVYVKDESQVAGITEYCKGLPEVEAAMQSEEAAGRFELCLDREGDLIVIARKDTVIGSRKDEHDLSNINDHRLRSHGGLSEQAIPLLMSRPARDVSRRQWRNFDAFDLLLNH